MASLVSSKIGTQRQAAMLSELWAAKSLPQSSPRMPSLHIWAVTRRRHLSWPRSFPSNRECSVFEFAGADASAGTGIQSAAMNCTQVLAFRVCVAASNTLSTILCCISRCRPDAVCCKSRVVVDRHLASVRVWGQISARSIFPSKS